MKKTDLREVCCGRNLEPLTENALTVGFVEQKGDEQILYRVNDRNLMQYCYRCKLPQGYDLRKKMIRGNRVLLVSTRSPSILNFVLIDLTSGVEILRGERAFSGRIHDVAWMNEGEIWVWLEESEEFEDLFHDLEKVTGRRRFVFAWKLKEDSCRLIKDYYLGIVAPEELTLLPGREILIAAHASRSEAEKRIRYAQKCSADFTDRDFLLEANSRLLSREIQEGRPDLTVAIWDQAELERTVQLITHDKTGLLVSRLFFLNDLRKLYHIAFGSGEKTLVSEDPAKSTIYRQLVGIGCCRIRKEHDCFLLDGLSSRNEWVSVGSLPESSGKPLAFADGCFFTQSGDVFWEYSAQGERKSVIPGQLCLTNSGIIFY